MADKKKTEATKDGRQADSKDGPISGGPGREGTAEAHLGAGAATPIQAPPTR